MTTFSDQVFQFGGQPVNGNDFAGWWGNNVYYVDEQDGADGHSGKSPTKAFKTLQRALDLADQQDTIYIRPRITDANAQSTYSSHGYYEGTNITGTTQQGLAIIGTGRGGSGSIGMGIQTMLAADNGSTDVCLTIKSPAMSIENLGMKALTGSNGAIYANSNTSQAWGLTVSNCFFKDFKTTSVAKGTIELHTIHWSTVQHCIFREAGMAINFASTYAATNGNTVSDCTFMGVASAWAEDIRVGDCKSLLIDNNRFLHAIPSGGGANKYVACVGTAGSGMVSNNTHSLDNTTVGSVYTLVDVVLAVNNFGDSTVIT